jgi:hypothetical protein
MKISLNLVVLGKQLQNPSDLHPTKSLSENWFLGDHDHSAGPALVVLWLHKYHHSVEVLQSFSFSSSRLVGKGVKAALEQSKGNQVQHLPKTSTENATVNVHAKSNVIEAILQVAL